MAAPASGEIPSSLTSACELRDAADGDASRAQLPYHFCDDGVPSHGGRDPNPGAKKAIAVPERYAGYRGLPRKAPAEEDAGADKRGNIALDADLSFPDPEKSPMPKRGYPLVVMMHGCCGGSKADWEETTIDAPESSEKWHYSNAWFASRGYVVLTYTSRGFVDGSGDGSTGESRLQHRRFEMNDFQHLTGQIADQRFRIAGERTRVDPRKIVATGGSYGGWFSWMALTDPSWRSPQGERMQLAAAAPKYGLTDLLYSLVPNGAHGRSELPPSDGSGTTSPIGFPKQSIVAGLYASGKTGIPPGSRHATFPESIDRAVVCAQSYYDPVESNPLCASTLATTLPSFVKKQSPYYQNRFFRRLERGDPRARVPVFSAGTFTDPLFPPSEHRRMAERLKSVDPRYPVQEYYGDYQHFVQNKRKEWSDLCGDEVCDISDYPRRNFNRTPDGFSRLGVTTRLNRLIDHYARPPANRREPKPRRDVTGALQICPQNATDKFPVDQPGKRFTASSFDRLAPHSLRLEMKGSRTTTSKAADPHSQRSDPVANQVANGGRCPVETTPAGPGVATYTSSRLDRHYTMLGRTRVIAPHTGSGSGIQLNARLYDVFPDGKQVMVDRGVRRVTRANETTVFDLHGNGWRFPQGHRVRIELTQDDSPYIRPSTQPSTLTLSGVTLKIPVREGSRDGGRRSSRPFRRR